MARREKDVRVSFSPLVPDASDYRTSAHRQASCPKTLAIPEIMGTEKTLLRSQVSPAHIPMFLGR